MRSSDLTFVCTASPAAPGFPDYPPKIEEDAGRNLRDGKVTASEETNRSMSSFSDPSNQKSLSCLPWKSHEEVSKSDGRLLWMFDHQWKKITLDTHSADQPKSPLLIRKKKNHVFMFSTSPDENNDFSE